MAYIRKYKDRWRAEVERNGKRKSAVWDTKREAQEWARLVETELLAGRGLSTENFGQAVTKYGAEVSTKKDGGKWELLRLAAMQEIIGADTPLADIGTPQVAAWRDLRLKTVSSSTVQREANLLRHVFTMAREEWKWMDQDPFKGVRLPKEAEHRHQVWRWQQIRRIVRKLGYVSGQKPENKLQEVALAFMISLRTSLRAAEVLRVGPTTFNPVTRVVVVKAKNMLRSEIPITTQGARLCKLADFTISSASLDVLFRKARDQVLLGDLHFHDARATALTLLARRVDILTLSRISQHKDLKMLMRYYRETSAQIAARL